jgi:hypothetical protein
MAGNWSAGSCKTIPWPSFTSKLVECKCPQLCSLCSSEFKPLNCYCILACKECVSARSRGEQLSASILSKKRKIVECDCEFPVLFREDKKCSESCSITKHINIINSLIIAKNAQDARHCANCNQKRRTAETVYSIYE